MSEDAPLLSWTCEACGETHDDLPAATFPAPEAWFFSSEEERASAFVLTADTCVWKDEHFFVRAVLEIPLIDRAGSFEFGVWSTLSPDNFERYMALFDSPERAASLEPMFGWFSNRLPGYPETLSLKCLVHPRDDYLRPTIELEATDHPLAVQQCRGIRFADAVAYLHKHMEF